MTDKIINISGVSCYEENGTAYLRLEDVARGLGFTEVHSGKEYVRWLTVEKYLRSIGFSQKVEKDGYIPENIFYRLAMKANNETAEKFQALVADKIIPSIRRNGGYIDGQEEMSPTEIMAKAVLLAQKTIADREARIAALAAKNAELTPKAEFADAITASKATILIGNLATVLKQNGCDIGQNRLFRYLRENGYLVSQKGDRYNTPTQRAMDMGLFEVDTSLFTTAYGNAKISYTTRVIPKGQQYFIDKFVKERGVNLMIPEAV